VDGDDGVLSIVRTAEHFLDFTGLDCGLELVETSDEIGGHILALPGPLDQDAQVLGAAFQRLTGCGVFFDAAAPLEDLLRFGLILPEVGLGDPLLDVSDLLRRVRGVKDTSGDLLRACSGLHIAVRLHQEVLTYVVSEESGVRTPNS
jgi:hypothetical protein